MMTAKEAQKMKRLELENAELRNKIDHHLDVYRDQLYELVELKAKLALVDSALHGEGQ